MTSLFDDDFGLPGYPAAFSPGRVHRYTCWRVWGDPSRYAQFLCLNPSVADETNDDPTVRRCIRYARDWGYGAFCMTNLFGYRATDPRDMKAAADPVGPDNTEWIMRISSDAGIVVAAWGAHGSFRGRAADIRDWFAMAGRPLHYLGLTAAGEPRHPLYLRAELRPILWA